MVIAEHDVLRTFRAVFGRAPTLLARAPGRANLIGEHTDYCDGFVLPFALDLSVHMAAASRDDNRLRIHTIDFGGQTAEVAISQLGVWDAPHWARTVQGGWLLLAEQGIGPGPADIAIGSSVPVGAGLSSSAAAEVAAVELGLALAGGSARLSQVEKALLAVRVEHEFLGMPCGNMDQIASAASLAGSAIRLDCRSLSIEPVPIPAGAGILLLNTMVSHNLAASEYPVRRAQTEKAAELLGVVSLRDATPGMVEAGQSRLGDVLYRRARHVTGENERVLEAQQALNAGELSRVGALLDASHASLRDDYEVSCEELDLMGSLARAQAGVYGARMMGGGFGGCVIALAGAAWAVGAAEAIAVQYAQQTGIKPEAYICAPAVGSSVTVL